MVAGSPLIYCFTHNTAMQCVERWSLEN